MESNQQPSKSEIESKDKRFSWDETLAQLAPVCILISATRDAAWGAARKIAHGSSCRLSWIDCDTVDADEAADLLRTHVVGHSAAKDDRILFLREVHALTPENQALLSELIAQRTSRRPRLIASSSLSLYEWVRQGLFDEVLFYKLNAVHIAL
jgi:sigma-54-interacting transcriptional regulator